MGKKKNVDKPTEDVDESTKDVDKPWDILMKLVMEKGAQAFASLALSGVQIGDALDKELRVTNIEGDLFLDAWLDRQQIIVHFEFQRKEGTIRNKDGKVKTMNRRMWEYNSAMDICMGRPVYSVLVYLMPENDLAQSPYVQEIPGTGLGHHFSFLVIKLWEVEGEVLKGTEVEELLPLLPLTKGGNTPQVVEEMVRKLVARGRSDLVELGLFCAGLVLKDEIHKRWFRERFGDGDMQSIIEDSWVYQGVIGKGREEGREEGRQQGFQQAAISIVKARFPELEQFASKIIETITDLNRLQVLIVELSTVSSQEDAREILRSLVSGA